MPPKAPSTNQMGAFIFLKKIFFLADFKINPKKD